MSKTRTKLSSDSSADKGCRNRLQLSLENMSWIRLRPNRFRENSDNFIHIYNTICIWLLISVALKTSKAPKNFTESN